MYKKKKLCMFETIYTADGGLHSYALATLIVMVEAALSYVAAGLCNSSGLYIIIHKAIILY